MTKKQPSQPSGHDNPPDLSRRSFLGKGSAVAATALIAVSRDAQAQSDQDVSRSSQSGASSSFLEILRVPDRVTAYSSFEKTLPANQIVLDRAGEQWSRGAVSVETRVENDALVLTLAASSTFMSVVHLRWQIAVSGKVDVLGDAWERSYGDLGWRNIIPERILPWYFATCDGTSLHGYGVKTDARALCFWQLDPEGVSLWLNVTNGGDGVALGSRRLTMATVKTRRGESGEEPVNAIRSLCRSLCARESRPSSPIYGANDWCYSYGRSTADSILRDTDFVVALSPTGAVRPFSVIDGGWQNATASWPDMGRLAHEIKHRTARPGIWIRPLEAPKEASPGLLLPDRRFGQNTGRAGELAYDPTVPQARDLISAKLRELAGWGYEMVKHDFTTYDLLGQWGFEMGPQPSVPGWSLHDRSRTNAEVITELYTLIREAVGLRVLLDGCNTVGHLGQGIFDLQRTGDDTSGHQWERTRRMGVNTLAFRLPQHGSFFVLDADVVGITDAIPWEYNRQWLDLLSRSGTATLVSAGPPARGDEQKAALREAFVIASRGGTGLIPRDGLQTSTPERWAAGPGSNQEKDRRYHWSGAAGTCPFLSP